MTRPGPTIAAIAESLLHPQGRFRRLSGATPVTDTNGIPRFTVTAETADFEAEADGTPCLLRFSLGENTRLRRNAQEHPFPKGGERFFIAPYEYLYEEMLFFDGTGTPQRTDLLLERLPPGALRLPDFVRTHLDRNGASILRRLLESVAEMYRTFDAEGIVHGHLKAANILVTTDGRPTAIRCLHSHSRDARNDRSALLRLSLAVYVSACMPPLFHMLWTSPTAEAWLPALFTQAEFDRNTPLIRIAAAAAADSTPPLHALPPELLRSPSPEETATLLDTLAALPFAPMPLLEALLETAANTSAHATAHDITVPYTATETAGPQTILLDTETCEHIGRPADTVVRYCKNGLWGYADAELRPLTAPVFTRADEFYEGRAAAGNTGGVGLIDRSGGFVMEPRFEALEWYGEWNVAAACLDGEWNLYDRCGKRLTASGYDWMAPPAEGTLLVRRRERFGFIDLTGQPVTELRYEEAFSFSDGRALVRTGHTAYFIDREGRRIK